MMKDEGWKMDDDRRLRAEWRTELRAEWRAGWRRL
jgi:hypothetical protein